MNGQIDIPNAVNRFIRIPECCMPGDIFAQLFNLAAIDCAFTDCFRIAIVFLLDQRFTHTAVTFRLDHCFTQNRIAFKVMRFICRPNVDVPVRIVLQFLRHLPGMIAPAKRCDEHRPSVIFSQYRPDEIPGTRIA